MERRVVGVWISWSLPPACFADVELQLVQLTQAHKTVHSALALWHICSPDATNNCWGGRSPCCTWSLRCAGSRCMYYRCSPTANSSMSGLQNHSFTVMWPGWHHQPNTSFLSTFRLIPVRLNRLKAMNGSDAMSTFMYPCLYETHNARLTDTPLVPH